MNRLQIDVMMASNPSRFVGTIWYAVLPGNTLVYEVKIVSFTEKTVLLELPQFENCHQRYETHSVNFLEELQEFETR